MGRTQYFGLTLLCFVLFFAAVYACLEFVESQAAEIVSVVVMALIWHVLQQRLRGVYSKGRIRGA
jgi:hypothetical protein